MNEIWEIDGNRIYELASDGIVNPQSNDGHGAEWSDKEPLILKGCRLETPDREATMGEGHLFTHNGLFSNEGNYLAMIINQPPDGFQSGECYEMAVQHTYSETDCFFLSDIPGYGAVTPYMECPRTAWEQLVPRFMLLSQFSFVDGQLSEDVDKVKARKLGDDR